MECLRDGLWPIGAVVSPPIAPAGLRARRGGGGGDENPACENVVGAASVPPLA
jgi:hypothetical protein